MDIPLSVIRRAATTLPLVTVEMLIDDDQASSLADAGFLVEASSNAARGCSVTGPALFLEVLQEVFGPDLDRCYENKTFKDVLCDGFAGLWRAWDANQHLGAPPEAGIRDFQHNDYP